MRHVRLSPSPRGPFNNRIRHVRRFVPHEGHHKASQAKYVMCVASRLVGFDVSPTSPRGLSTPNAGESERWRAHPRCSGERGRDQPALVEAHSGTAGLHHRRLKRVRHTHTALPPSCTMHSQMRGNMCRGLRWACTRHHACLFCACTRVTSDSSAFSCCLSRPDPP